MCHQTSQHGTNHHMIGLATPGTGGEGIPPASKEHDLLSMSDKSKPIVVDVRVNDIAVEMELDTGASQSIMSSETSVGCLARRQRDRYSDR